MYVQRSRLLRILSPHSFSVYLATCWQKYLISFMTNFTEKVGACAFSVYQALSPPLKGPGDEARSRAARAATLSSLKRRRSSFEAKTSHLALKGVESMSRNARTRSQLLSVYYNLTPCHARLLNVLSSMGIKIYRSQATKQGQKYKMRRFSHE